MIAARAAAFVGAAVEDTVRQAADTAQRAAEAAGRAADAASGAADSAGRVVDGISGGLSGWLAWADLGSLKPILTALLLPPVPWIVLILLAWSVSRRFAAAGGILVLVAVAGLWLGSTAGTAEWLTRGLLHPPEPLTPAALRQLDRDSADTPTAIVVLGGGVDALAPERGTPWLKPTSAARLAYGLTLARQTGWPLAFSGGVGFAATPDTPTEAQAAALMAREAGIALRWQEDRSRDTRENAVNTVSMLRAAGIRRIVVVTDNWHMTRAMVHFRRAAESVRGGTAPTIVAAPMGNAPLADRPAMVWLPTPDGELRVRRVLREWLGMLVA